MEICNDWLENLQIHKETNTLSALLKAHRKSVVTEYLADRRESSREPQIPTRDAHWYRIVYKTIKEHVAHFTMNNCFLSSTIYELLNQFEFTKNELHNLSYMYSILELDLKIQYNALVESVRDGKYVLTEKERELITDLWDDSFIIAHWELLDLSPERIIMENTDLTKETFDYFFYKIDNPEFMKSFFKLLPGRNGSNLKFVDETHIAAVLKYTTIEEICDDNGIDKLVQCNVSPSVVMDALISSWETIIDGKNEVQLTRLYNNIAHIGYNPNITCEFIDGYLEYLNVHPEMNLFWKYLANNNKAFGRVIRQYPEQFTRESKYVKCRNKSLTLETVLYMERECGYNWDWELLSSNPSVANPETIEANPDLPWVWGRYGISGNPSLTPEFIKKHKEKLCFSNGGEDYFTQAGTVSSLNNVITYELVKELGDDIQWGYCDNGLSGSKNLTIPWVCEYSTRRWDWREVFVEVGNDDEISARAIQSAWRLWKTRQMCRELSADVIEWWYSPDCRPGNRMRRGLCMGEWAS